MGPTLAKDGLSSATPATASTTTDPKPTKPSAPEGLVRPPPMMPVHFRTHVTAIGDEPVIMVHTCEGDRPLASVAMTRDEARVFGMRFLRFARKAA